jgi:ribosome maturation factor RimP
MSQSTKKQSKQWSLNAKKDSKKSKGSKKSEKVGLVEVEVEVEDGVGSAELGDDEELDEEDAEFSDDDDWSDEDDQWNDYSRATTTGDVAWGKMALECATAALEECNAEIGPIEFYSFRVNPANFRIYVRLDKMEDKFGSPLMDDIMLFTRKFNAKLEEKDAPQEIESEVSSPGAERIVRVPEELARFSTLPMRVCHQVQSEDGKTLEQYQVLSLVSLDLEREESVWTLANVRANWPGKGRKLSKKKLEAEIKIATSAITKANLHVDL